MTVLVGGIMADRKACWPANNAIHELGLINHVDDDDWEVDLCFKTHVVDGLNADQVAGTGIAPMMVGRTQRRFIISLEVPPDLPDRRAYAQWLVEALSESARLTRDYLPTKNKKYPADRLAAELEDPSRSLAHARRRVSGQPLAKRACGS